MRATFLRKRSGQVAAGVAVAAVLGVGAVAVAGGRSGDIRERLSGYEEVPALSTRGEGTFRAWVNRSRTEIHYRLHVEDLGSDFMQAHIHFENATNNGPVVVFLCSNLGNGPEGTQACPAGGGWIRGVIEADDVTTGGAAQGLDAGEIGELVKAIRAGATYVNVHSADFPAGEIRAQLGNDHHHDGDHHDG